MACGVVALQGRVVAQLLALLARAPAELGRLLLESCGALAVGAGGVLVVGVLALEPERLAGGVEIEPLECLVLLVGERAELLVWQLARVDAELTLSAISSVERACS